MVIQLLLDEGAEVDSKNEAGYMPLWSAIVNKRGDKTWDEEWREDSIRLLLRGGAQINVKDNKGRTLLQEATRNGYRGAVRLLLENGAVVDEKVTRVK